MLTSESYEPGDPGGARPTLPPLGVSPGGELQAGGWHMKQGQAANTGSPGWPSYPQDCPVGRRCGRDGRGVAAGLPCTKRRMCSVSQPSLPYGSCGLLFEMQSLVKLQDRRDVASVVASRGSGKLTACSAAGFWEPASVECTYASRPLERSASSKSFVVGTPRGGS